MLRLMLSIREDAKKRKINNKTIAVRLNVSEGQVSNYFKLNYRIPFNKFIELLNLIYEDKKQIDKHIESFLNETNKAENLKEAAEWFSVNGDYQRVSSVVKNHKRNECIFEIYELLVKRKNREINRDDFYRNVEKIKEIGVTNPETKILCRIACAYANLDFKAFTTLEFLASDTLTLIDQLNNNFIQTSYKLRCYELIAIANIARNDLEKAESILLKAINEVDFDTFPIPVIAFLSLLSELYVFSDFQKSLSYNKKAFEVLNKVQNKNSDRYSILEATHDFIKIHNNDYSNLFLTNPAEKAHLLAKIGGTENIQSALVILEELELKNDLTPFQLYYKGLALNDKNLLEKSEYEFLIRGNLYYSCLPRRILEEKY